MLPNLSLLRPQQHDVNVALPDDVVDMIAEHESSMQSMRLEIRCFAKPHRVDQETKLEVYFEDLLRTRKGPGVRPGIVVSKMSSLVTSALQGSWDKVIVEFYDWVSAGNKMDVSKDQIHLTVRYPKGGYKLELKPVGGQVETTRTLFEAIKPILERLLSNAGLFRQKTDTLHLTINPVHPWGGYFPFHRKLTGRVDVIRHASDARKVELRRVLAT